MFRCKIKAVARGGRRVRASNSVSSIQDGLAKMRNFLPKIPCLLVFSGANFLPGHRARDTNSNFAARDSRVWRAVCAVLMRYVETRYAQGACVRVIFNQKETGFRGLRSFRVGGRGETGNIFGDTLSVDNKAELVLPPAYRYTRISFLDGHRGKSPVARHFGRAHLGRH